MQGRTIDPAGRHQRCRSIPRIDTRQLADTGFIVVSGGQMEYVLTNCSALFFRTTASASSKCKPTSSTPPSTSATLLAPCNPLACSHPTSPLSRPGSPPIQPKSSPCSSQIQIPFPPRRLPRISRARGWTRWHMSLVNRRRHGRNGLRWASWWIPARGWLCLWITRQIMRVCPISLTVSARVWFAHDQKLSEVLDRILKCLRRRIRHDVARIPMHSEPDLWKPRNNADADQPLPRLHHDHLWDPRLPLGQEQTDDNQLCVRVRFDWPRRDQLHRPMGEEPQLCPTRLVRQQWECPVQRGGAVERCSGTDKRGRHESV